MQLMLAMYRIIHFNGKIGIALLHIRSTAHGIAVKHNYIFTIHDPDLPYLQLYTLYAATMTIYGSLLLIIRIFMRLAVVNSLLSRVKMGPNNGRILVEGT